MVRKGEDVVSAAPNRTALVARVEGRRPHPSVGKWDVLTLRVVSSAPVDGYHDMIRAHPGQQLTVAVDRDWLPAEGDLSGRSVRLSATVAGPDVITVAYADPAVTLLPDQA